jgi:Dolichyl-phosphate-mannose-protein mannosyltransferase
MRQALSSARIDAKSPGVRLRIAAKPAVLAGRVMGALKVPDLHDRLILVVFAVLGAAVWLTFRDYAISNDEAVQHHYGELIIAYYRSGFKVRDLFTFDNLYLYGGLFDIIAVGLADVIPIDPYELRHLLCAMTGIGGIAASAATARLIAGPRAGLISAVVLALCGAWYGAMFNHTKDIPFAAAMMGAMLFVIRIARQLPSPRAVDLAGFGLLAGAALGIRSLGLLLLFYLALAVVVSVPWRQRLETCAGFAANAAVRIVPAVALAALVMILAWPWAALSPFNSVRGLLAFSEFHYAIRTMFAGRVYEMADVPRLYVPSYLLVRVPLITLAGAALGVILSLLWPPGRQTSSRRRDLILISSAIVFPLAFEVLFRGPAFTGMRHFLFVLPPLAALAGVGLSELIDLLETCSGRLASSAIALICACFLWDGVTLVRLHPYENLSYNSLVGGLPGAFRRYDLDYWFNSMPEAIHLLEAFVRDKMPAEVLKPSKIYSVAVCGERPAFDQTVTLPQLHWDFRSKWDESEFFIAPTQMNCDQDLDGEIIGTVERFGVPIAYVKDRRSLVRWPMVTITPPVADRGYSGSRE